MIAAFKALCQLNILARATNPNQHIVPIPIVIHNPVQTTYQSSIEDTSPPPPPPYSAKSSTNFDDSLPSYERAISRPL